MALEIVEVFSIAGLSGVISGVSVAVASHFLELRKLKTLHAYDLDKLKNERKKEEITKKIGVYSTLIFHLSRMANNEDFKNKGESADKIVATVDDIDELLKNRFYLVSEKIFIKWLNLRSDLKKINPNPSVPVPNHSQIISNVNGMGRLLIEEYSSNLYTDYKELIGKFPVKISENIFPKDNESLTPRS